MLTKNTYHNVQMFFTLSMIGNKTIIHSYIIVYVTHRFKIETAEYWYMYW